MAWLWEGGGVRGEGGGGGGRGGGEGAEAVRAVDGVGGGVLRWVSGAGVREEGGGKGEEEGGGLETSSLNRRAMPLPHTPRQLQASVRRFERWC